jgi:thioredoxin reductase (NADPH)
VTAPAVDLLVVGAGPVGIAVAIEASRSGLSARVVEKGALCNTLVGWPESLVFFSTPGLLEIGDLPFVTSGAKPTRREGLVYYRKAAARYALDVRLYERVLSVVQEGDLFRVATSKGSHEARRVVVATGFFDTPNLLGVPGEQLPKVSHYYREPWPYAGTDVLVAGGGNSAVEAALELHRTGARVTLAVRGEDLKPGVKYWLRPDVENRIREGSIRALFRTAVTRIEEGRVALAGPDGPFEVANDFVLALTGYRPDFPFLRALGVEVTPEGVPVFDAETMETNVPGLHLAGVVAAGVHTGRLFIENGRHHAVAVARHAAKALGRGGASPSARPIGLFQDGE